MRAKDMARAVAFYRDALGLPLLFEVADPEMAFFDMDGVRLMLATPQGPHDHPGSILYFQVDDITTTHRGLTEGGVVFDTEPALIADMGDHELWMAFFKDSEENQLALMSEVVKAPT
jgi:methylmalonyl-CoA/ethylmalonyl-CoA epimerase